MTDIRRPPRSRPGFVPPAKRDAATSLPPLADVIGTPPQDIVDVLRHGWSEAGIAWMRALKAECRARKTSPDREGFEDLHDAYMERGPGMRDEMGTPEFKFLMSEFQRRDRLRREGIRAAQMKEYA